MKILIYTFLILFANCSFAQHILVNEYDENSKLEHYNLKGKIAQITSTATDHEGKSTTLPFLENEFYNQVNLEFNKAGFLIKRTNFLEYAKKLGIYSFIEQKYNSNNKLIEQKTTVLNNGEDPLRISSLKEFSYHANGNLSEIKEVVKGKNSTSNYITEFIYTDKLNQVITKVDRQITSKNQLIYNKKGLLIKEETTSFDGKKGLKKFYIYDNNTPIYFEENNANKKQISFLNLDKKETKFQEFDQNQNLKLELTYNENKNVTQVKIQSFVQGKPVLKTYDLNYDFDNNGNWIICKVSNNNQLKYLVTRNIIYY